MKLTNRLKTIADLVEKQAIVGDIGSDHGYLMAYLKAHDIIDRGIASDINQGPVDNCKETIKSHGFTDKIDVRLGGGFVPYKKNEIDTAVIAGMGGDLIRDIFLESIEVVKTIKTFILQPMTGQTVIRKWLVDNHFKIILEKIAIEQDRFYEIMVVTHGDESNETLSQLEDDLLYEIGYKMIENEDYLGFIDKKIAKYDEISTQIEKHSNIDHPKYISAQKNLKKLNEVKACIQTQKK